MEKKESVLGILEKERKKKEIQDRNVFFVTDREQVRKERNRVVVPFLLKRESDKKKEWKKG